MGSQRLGIILSGVTGRIGVNQHLGRAVAALREAPLTLANGDRLTLDPVLVGRDAAKLQQVAKRFGIERWTPTSTRRCRSARIRCSSTPL